MFPAAAVGPARLITSAFCTIRLIVFPSPSLQLLKALQKPVKGWPMPLASEPLLRSEEQATKIKAEFGGANAEAKEEQSAEPADEASAEASAESAAEASAESTAEASAEPAAEASAEPAAAETAAEPSTDAAAEGGEAAIADSSTGNDDKGKGDDAATSGGGNETAPSADAPAAEPSKSSTAVSPSAAKSQAPASGQDGTFDAQPGKVGGSDFYHGAITREECERKSNTVLCLRQHWRCPYPA